ncbi:zinc finger BED domain-containing protein DAYSLEEPER-like [Neltuma alba]|uniref:zinc finger BED domain-containing protein DAYSLEEPER-like n=2 Tax=Neltuma alba TaxID=207710 RepID=UPI0010A4A9E3|nr:zinc finger BED domain-containing protein DAYSLEEPER-like isoform X1 [Prosopis alba]XP_028791566.1 zinc finger BED domain-containing protein DAYSLEEPER-like [Prosopis alba]
MNIPALMEIDTALTPVDDNEQADPETQPGKRQRKKSMVWEHFTVENVGAGCTRAYCKQCKKSFAYITGSKVAGTSHLKRHISLGICPVSRQNNPQSLYPTTGGSGDIVDLPRKRARETTGFAGMSLDQDRSNRDITKMIILHDYPLHIVEHRGFIDFVHSLQPQFNVPSSNSVQEDCVGIYLREKKNLLNLIDGIPGRVNLTIDLWTSSQTAGYIFLRGHFIDADWNLHRPILSVIMAPFPDSDDSVSQSILNCLTDWHLEGRLFTLALDQSFSNETLIGSLRGLLSVKNPVILNGQLLSCNCYARVLSRLALHALWAMRETIGKVRECVKYVKTSESHEEKFLELKQQLQVPSMKDLIIDDKTKWDTTYHMLVAACELKEVFACFDTSDPDFRMILSMGEWKQIETLCTYLKYLFDAANILTTLPFPTANLFFHEVAKLQLDLTHAAVSQDPFLSDLIKPLQEKFDQYWRESCLILAVAVAMDPRYKLELVEFTFTKIFGENSEPWIRIVEDGLRELFLEYIVQMLPFTASNGDEGNEDVIRTDSCQDQSFDESLLVAEDGLSDFDIYISDFTCNQQMKSELEQYLEDPLLPSAEEFDILSWWRLNRLKYPTLSTMASDILSIPVSTLSADSVFDTKLRNMNCSRSSLSSMTLEALICAKDWFQYESLPIDVSNALVEMGF